MKRNLLFLTAAMACIAFLASTSFAQIRQTKLYIDDGSGNFTILKAPTGGSGGTITLPAGTGSISLGSALAHMIETYLTTGSYSSGNAGEQLLAMDTASANTNISIAIQPKGTGALEAQIADGTAAGGNIRGQGAVDWQMSRTANTEIASGTYSTVSGGQSNTANGYGATVAGGGYDGSIVQGNVASGPASFVGGGLGDTASKDYSTVAGGLSNTAIGYGATVAGGGYDGSLTLGNVASGNASFVGGGLNNTASGNYATIGGGQQNTASYYDATVSGGYANTASTSNSTVSGGASNSASVGIDATVSGGYENNAGNAYATVSGGRSDSASGTYATVSGGYANTASNSYATVSGGLEAKASQYGQHAQASGDFGTQGDAQTSVFTERNATTDATATNLFLDGNGTSIAVPTNGAMNFQINIIGKQSSSANMSAWDITGAVVNNGGTLTLATLTATSITNTVGGGTPSISVSGTNLVITVTGVAGTNIRWVARVETAEVTY